MKHELTGIKIYSKCLEMAALPSPSLCKIMTRSLRSLLDIHGFTKAWKTVFRNFLGTEPGSWDCTGEDILFLSGVILQNQVKHCGITTLKKLLSYVHFYKTDSFSLRSIWGMFFKKILKESDYEVDSGKAGDLSLSGQPPHRPAPHGMSRNAQAEEHRWPEGSHSDCRPPYRAQFGWSLLKMLTIFWKFCWGMLLFPCQSESSSCLFCIL